MKDLLGGDERIEAKSGVWSDGFIVNLGLDELEGDDKYVSPYDLGNWHVDGDFFVCSTQTQTHSPQPLKSVVIIRSTSWTRQSRRSSLYRYSPKSSLEAAGRSYAPKVLA